RERGENMRAWAMLAAALLAGSAAHADDICRVEVLANATGLEAAELGGKVVRPAAREDCKWGRYFVSPMPTTRPLSQVHLSDRGLCEYLSYITGPVISESTLYLLKPDGECPLQNSYLYTETHGISQEEFLALDAYWRGLVRKGKVPIDAILARRVV